MLSIICPIYNEAKYIEGCIQSILLQDYPKEHLEVLFVDGMSQDGTRDIVGDNLNYFITIWYYEIYVTYKMEYMKNSTILVSLVVFQKKDGWTAINAFTNIHNAVLWTKLSNILVLKKDLLPLQY